MKLTYNPNKINMGLGDATPDIATAAANSQSVTNQIIEAIGKIMPLVQQQKIFNAQLNVAKQQAKTTGILDTSNLTPPGIPLSVGLDTNTKMMIGVGLGALALILLMKKR